MRKISLRRSGSLFLVAACALVAIRCSSENITSPENTVVSVTVDPPAATIRLGATVQLSATAKNASNGAVAGSPVYSSSDETVVTVSASGLARALKIGTATLTAKFGSISGSAAITVTSGFPASLTKLAGDNQSGTAATAVAVAPSVQVKDSVGNAVSGVTVTFAVASGGGSVTGTSATTNASGTATVGGWTLGATPGTNTLTATVQGASAPVVATFTVVSTAGTPTQLVVATAPAGAVSAVAFTTQPVIEVRSAAGALATTASTTVTATVSAGGQLIGTTSVATAGGVARFTDLGLQTAGTYTLTFSAPNLTPATAQIVVAQGLALTATGITITATRGVVEPDLVLIPVNSNSLSTQISGLAVASITYTNPNTTGWLKATLTSAASTPSNLVVEAHVGTINPGTYTANVTITGNKATPVVVPVQLIVNGLAPASLAVRTQPATGKVAVPFAVQPVIEFRDPNGLLATQVTDTVRVQVQSGPGTLVGTTTVTAVNGVATFTDLSVTAAGTYVFLFSSGLLPTVSSGLIVVSNPAAGLAITTPPAGARGNILNTQPVVRLVDANGAAVTDETFTITLTVTGPANSGYFATYTATTAFGVANFIDVAITGPAGIYKFDFTTSGLAGTATVSVNFP